MTGATRSCSANKILEETGWESLETRRRKHRLTTFYKMVTKTTPSYLSTLVPRTVHQVSQRNLRTGQNLQVPRSRTVLYSNSFIPKTIRDWNALPNNLKNSPSLNSFKLELNRDLPKIPKYYLSGDRKAQILHTRLRLGCSSLNSDLFNNHVSNTDRCICGSQETAKHFLLECPKYIDTRNTTINSLNIAYDLDILLKGCPLFSDEINERIFLAVQNFITQSNRFG